MADKLEGRFLTFRRKHKVPKSFGGITKDRIRQVLGAVRLDRDDFVDSVFALLDDHLESQFGSIRSTMKFRDGATTAHVGCHVGMLQRRRTKADREVVRDYWLKPLRDVGAVEPITLMGSNFIPGHVKAKSPNSAFRLAADFVELLESNEDQLDQRVRRWASEDAIRARRAKQDEAAKRTRANLSGSEHSHLIADVQMLYAPIFAPGFEVLYIDEDDGDRITAEERSKLRGAGLDITLDDSWPDVLLFHRVDRSVWWIEAVTSDGEIDHHKVEQVSRWAEREGIVIAGMTTAYRSLKDFARRQERHRNIAPGTFIWIAADPDVQLALSRPTSGTKPNASVRKRHA